MKRLIFLSLLIALPALAQNPATPLPRHASTHQNGGSDEIATATPGANAIPKAGSGGTLATGWIPATPAIIAGTTHTMTAPREYFLCSTATTCSVTLPVPAAGYEFCIRSDNNVSTAITLAAITSPANVYYEKPDRTGWGTAGHSIASGPAVNNQICLIGYDSTHYAIMSSVGTWTNTP